MGEKWIKGREKIGTKIERQNRSRLLILSISGLDLFLSYY